MREKYVIAKYLRLSSEDGDKPESDSIVNQRYLIDFYIKDKFKNKDVEAIELIDDGYSGTNMNRPGMKKLLILAETKEISCVIVKDFSRFARDYVEVGLYAEQKFPEWQIRFISVNDRYDSLDFRGITGGIDVAMKNIAHTMYSRDLSEKIKSARKIQYKEGKYIATYAFYGYKKSPEDKHKLIIDPQAAEVVKSIFNMRLGGMKPSQIAITLNRQGILTPAQYKREVEHCMRKWNNPDGFNFWTDDAIHRILKDERYTGKLISGKTESVSFGGTKTKRVKNENAIIAYNTHEAIISQDMFDKVRHISNNVRNPKPSPVSLSGLVRCGGCGHLMYRHNTAGKTVKYVCEYKKYAEPNNCFKGGVSEKDLAELLSKLIKTEIEKTVDTKKARKRIADLYKAKEKRISRLQKEVDEQKRKKLSEYMKLTRGQLSEDVFLANKEKADVKISRLEKEIDDMKYQTVPNEDLSVLELFTRYMDKEELNREVIKDLIKTIYIFPDKRVEIVWNFKNDLS